MDLSILDLEGRVYSSIFESDLEFDASIEKKCKEK